MVLVERHLGGGARSVLPLRRGLGDQVQTPV